METFSASFKKSAPFFLDKQIYYRRLQIDIVNRPSVRFNFTPLASLAYPTVQNRLLRRETIHKYDHEYAKQDAMRE